MPQRINFDLAEPFSINTVSPKEMLSLFRKSKPEQEDPGRFLREHAAQINGSLCVFGDWFGRPTDNWHQLVSHEEQEAYVRLTFNEGAHRLRPGHRGSHEHRLGSAAASAFES